MRATLGFLRAQVQTNLKASVALRGAFWLRAAFMFLNNFIFLLAWVLFFSKYDNVRGWRIEDMAALFAVAAGGFGLSVVLGHGVHDLSRLVTGGGLDAWLSQPKSPLVKAIASRSEAAGWGDMASSVVLFALCGHVDLVRIPLCLVGALCACAVLLATAVLVQSLAFWLGDVSTFSRQMWNFLLFFGMYPRTIFGGWLKVLLFTAIPAGFITYLPVDLLREFHWSTLGAAVGGAAGYCLLAAAVFRLGLRRYT